MIRRGVMSFILEYKSMEEDLEDESSLNDNLEA